MNRTASFDYLVPSKGYWLPTEFRHRNPFAIFKQQIAQSYTEVFTGKLSAPLEVLDYSGNGIRKN
jgi:hypothetical protein